MNDANNQDDIIERLDRPDSPEELATRNVSGPDGNLEQGPPLGTGVPGDSGGPDIWGNDSGPLQPPPRQGSDVASARSDASPGTMGIPPIGQEESGDATTDTPQGYVSSSGGLGGGGNVTGTGTTTGAVRSYGQQPRAQAAASTDPTAPESMGTATAGTSIGPTTMGPSRPAGPHPDVVTTRASGTTASEGAAPSDTGSAPGTRAGSDETTPGEINQFNVPGGTGPTNAEPGDVGMPSALPAPHAQP